MKSPFAISIVGPISRFTCFNEVPGCRSATILKIDYGTGVFL